FSRIFFATPGSTHRGIRRRESNLALKSDAAFMCTAYATTERASILLVPVVSSSPFNVFTLKPSSPATASASQPCSASSKSTAAKSGQLELRNEEQRFTSPSASIMRPSRVPIRNRKCVSAIRNRQYNRLGYSLDRKNRRFAVSVSRDHGNPHFLLVYCLLPTARHCPRTLAHSRRARCQTISSSYQARDDTARSGCPDRHKRGTITRRDRYRWHLRRR